MAGASSLDGAGTVTSIDVPRRPRRTRRTVDLSTLPSRLVDTATERGLLASVVLGRKAFTVAVDTGVRADDFYGPKHRRLWEAVVAVYAAPDVPHALPELIADRLASMGQPIGLADVTELWTGDYSASDAPGLARAVVELSVARQTWSASEALKAAIASGDPAAHLEARTHLDAAEQRTRTNIPDSLSNYRERNGVMEWCRSGPAGQWEQLANWTGRITAELVTADDEPLEWEVEAQLPGEEPVTVNLRVPEEIDKAASVIRANLGPRAKIVAGGRTMAEHVLLAVQSLSGPVPRLILHDRVGLVRLDDGAWVYVDSAGAHGVGGLVDGVRTRLPDALALYRLPEGEELLPLAECMPAVVRFRDLGNAGAPIGHVTVPLLGARLAAVALEGPAGFGLQLLADNGVGKSAIAAAFGGFYGSEWRHDRLPVPARSATSLAMQRLASGIRDAVLVVDDVPLSTSGANRRSREDVAAAAHATANGAGRQALTRTGEMREARPVEALTLYTGEQVAAVDQAGESRLLVLDVKRSEFTLREVADDGTAIPGPAAAGLTDVQADVRAGRLASFHAHQLRWIIEDVEGARQFMSDELPRLRSAPSEGLHPRHAEHLAKVGAGFELHLSHLVAAGVVTEAEAEADWRHSSWPALLETARRQSLPPEVGPGPKMLHHLAAVIASRGAFLTSRAGGVPEGAAGWGWEVLDEYNVRHGSGPRVGLVDDDGTVHLFPEVALKAAEQLGAAIDDPIGAPARVVGRSLAEAGLIVAPSGDGAHMHQKVRLGDGVRTRVLTLTETGAQILAGIEPPEPPRPVLSAPELRLWEPGAGWRTVAAPAFDIEAWDELTGLLEGAPADVAAQIAEVLTAAGLPAPGSLVVEDLDDEQRRQLADWLATGTAWLRAALGLTPSEASASITPSDTPEPAPEPVEAPEGAQMPSQALIPPADSSNAGEAAPAPEPAEETEARRSTGRKTSRATSWADRYCYGATDGARLYLDDGEIIAGPWPDAGAMADAARASAAGRALVVFVHESAIDTLGLPERPGTRAEDGSHRVPWVAAAASECRRVHDLGDAAEGVLTSTDGTKAHIVFPAYGADFGGTDSPAALLEAVRAFCDGIGFAWLHSAASTVHNLVTMSRGRQLGPIPPAGPEPQLDGEWVDSAWAVPGNVWALDVEKVEDVAGRWLRTYDRRGSYLSAWRGAELPEGAWSHRAGPFPLDTLKLAAGYWQIRRDLLAQLVPAGMPDPFARHGKPAGEAVWLTTPLVQLAGELAHEAGEALMVEQAWTAELRPRRLDAAAAKIAAARSALEESTASGARVALDVVKEGYAGATAWFEHARRDVSHPLARPAWRRTIIDRFTANTWRGLRKMAPGQLVALGDVDTAAVLVEAADADPVGLDLSPQLGKWKPKGHPVAAADAVEALKGGGGRAVLRLTDGGGRP